MALMARMIAIGALMASALAAPAFAAAIDSQAEIAAALYAASATQAATQRLTDKTIQAERQKIDALTAQVRSGAAQRAALVAAQNHYVAQLAALDQTYSVEIAVFRGAVTDIASTPEGLEALAKYNAGDAQGALSILDQLRAARAAARRKADDIANAADARATAELALDARGHGKGDTAQVTARYEEVTQLDPAENWDWNELTRLYEDAGRLADAGKAAQKAVDTATNDRDRSVGLEEEGDILRSQGDLAGGRKAYEASLAIDTKAAAANPGSAMAQQDIEIDYGRLGVALREQGDLPGARNDFEAALATARRLSGANPSSTDLRRDLVVSLTRLGDVQIAQGDLTAAHATLQENAAIVRALLRSRSRIGSGQARPRGQPEQAGPGRRRPVPPRRCPQGVRRGARHRPRAGRRGSELGPRCDRRRGHASGARRGALRRR